MLGKLAVELAPPEPELLHAALRLTARGWETGALPAPDGSGSLVVALDLHAHEAVVEHSRGSVQRMPLVPDRPVAEVTRDVLAAVARAGGAVRINPVPQEVPWSVPLDEDYEHARYDPGQVEEYFAAATQAALALAAFRAPYRGRSTPVNAWWGSFDLCVVMFSGARADPPSDDFIARNASDAQQVVVGWWPGDARSRAAFYAYAYPAPPPTRTPQPWTFSARPFTMPTGTPDGAPSSVPPWKAGRPPSGDRITGRPDHHALSVQPGEPAYARWRTDIRVDYRITPPLLRSELLDDATLGSFRPFHGFQGSSVPVPPDIAATLSERAAPRLVILSRPG